LAVLQGKKHRGRWLLAADSGSAGRKDKKEVGP